MAERVTVRRATESDVGEIQQVAERTWYETYEGILSEESIESMLAAGYSTELLEELIESEVVGLFVATVDDEVIGYTSTTPLAEDGISELDVYVDAGYWGEGIGTRLLDRASEHLSANGVEEISDAVLAENEPGNAFYGSHFEKVDERSIEIGGVERAANVYAGPIE